MRISDWSSDVCSSDLLDEVVRQAIREAVPLAEPGIDIDFRDTADGATVNGDTVMLREAVKTVLDNAVRHGRAGAGGSIALRPFTDRTDAPLCISFSDGAPGITEPHRARVVGRFRRGPWNDAP